MNREEELTVSVKPLEWVDMGEGPRCITVCGMYSISPQGEKLVLTGIPGNRFGKFKNIGEAKAAAQADYESRIRSALLPTPKREATEGVTLAIAENSLKNEARRLGPLTTEEIGGVFARLKRTIFTTPKPEAEPVAWVDQFSLEMVKRRGGGLAPMCATKGPSHRPNCTVPLYTHPPIPEAAHVIDRTQEYHRGYEDGYKDARSETSKRASLPHEEGLAAAVEIFISPHPINLWEGQAFENMKVCMDNAIKAYLYTTGSALTAKEGSANG